MPTRASVTGLARATGLAWLTQLTQLTRLAGLRPGARHADTPRLGKPRPNGHTSHNSFRCATPAIDYRCRCRLLVR